MGWLYKGVCHATSSNLISAIGSEYPKVVDANLSMISAPGNFVFYNEGGSSQYFDFTLQVRNAGVSPNIGANVSIYKFRVNGELYCVPSTVDSGQSGIFSSLPEQDILIFIALAFSFILGLQAGRK